jgi:hypothetical protein
MPEIDENTLSQLRGAHQLLDKLLRDPKTRRDAEKLVKVHRPDFPTVEDAAEPYIKQIAALEKKLDTFLESQSNAKQDAEADAAFGRLRASGYTDEGIGKIKNLMKERTIPDVEAAAALFDKLNPAPPPQPPGFRGTSWGIGDTAEADNKLLFENEDQWAEQEAHRAWRETA